MMMTCIYYMKSLEGQVGLLKNIKEIFDGKSELLIYGVGIG
jgi:hypothetical protein